MCCFCSFVSMLGKRGRGGGGSLSDVLFLFICERVVRTFGSMWSRSQHLGNVKWDPLIQDKLPLMEFFPIAEMSFVPLAL